MSKVESGKLGNWSGRVGRDTFVAVDEVETEATITARFAEFVRQYPNKWVQVPEDAKIDNVRIADYAWSNDGYRYTEGIQLQPLPDLRLVGDLMVYFKIGVDGYFVRLYPNQNLLSDVYRFNEAVVVGVTEVLEYVNVSGEAVRMLTDRREPKVKPEPVKPKRWWR